MTRLTKAVIERAASAAYGYWVGVGPSANAGWANVPAKRKDEWRGMIKIALQAGLNEDGE